MAARVWTPARKVLGNVMPLLLSAPLAVAGLLSYRPDEPFALAPLLLLAGFPVVGWMVLNFFGLWANASMRDELGRRYGREHGARGADLVFVGYARPEFRSAWDPHEDVGFLVFETEHIRLYGDAGERLIRRADINRVGRQRNVHSWVGYGGWIVLETSQGKLLLEPRECLTLIGNKRYARELVAKIEGWRATPGCPGSTPSAQS